MSSKATRNGIKSSSDAEVLGADGAGVEILDSKHVAQLRALMVGGKSTLFSELSAIFRKEAPARLQLLRDAVASGNFTDSARLSHAFVGSAASIGARHLQSCMKALELGSLDGEKTRIAQALSEVNLAWDRLEAELVRLEGEDRS